jgi:malonyl CoA-acyl carrier protein transacylase
MIKESLMKPTNTSSYSHKKPYFSLSFEQERMWVLDQLKPGNPSYNIRGGTQIIGLINLDILKQSINEIIRRHEILRTTFDVIDGQPRQIITSPFNVDLAVVDLQKLGAVEQKQAVERMSIESVQQSFNLRTGPLWRIILLQMEPTKYLMVLTLHHIICDGDWSIGIFFQEMATLYEAIARGKQSPLLALPLQYKEFAIRQKQYLQGEILENQLSYWKQQLGKQLSVLQLPTDYPRPAIQTYAGAYCQLNLPHNLSEQLKILSQSQGLTLFTVLLAAFKTLLYRYNRQEDITIGSPVAGRNIPGTEGMIGYFGNPVVLRTDMAGNPTFLQLLSRVAKVVEDAQKHQDYPFQKLVEELKPERDMSFSPLFQVLFILRDDLMPNLEFSTLSLTPSDVESKSVPYDWFISVKDTEQGLVWTWEYNTDLFESATINRIMNHFENLLKNIIANPQKHIGEIVFLTEVERNELLVGYNNTKIEYPSGCIHQLFELQVQQTPEAIAVVYENQQLTYRELNQRANRLAHYLQTQGVEAESLVGICIERSLEMVIAILAVLKSGGAYVPLDSGYPKDRLEYIASDANIQLLLSTELLLRTSSPILDITATHQIICLDRDWQIIADQDAENLDSAVNSHNLAYVIYTSGSTGQPKGVMMEHKALMNMISWHLQNRTVGVKTLQFASISFDLSFHEIFSTWCSGGTLVLISEEVRHSPVDLLKTITQTGIEKLYLSFIALQQLVEVIDEQTIPITLREVMTAGEQLQITPKITQFFRQIGATLHNHYGATEVPEIATFTLTGDAKYWATLPPIGRPINNIQIYLLDEFFQPVPLGVPGELYVGGAGIARGYFNRPELTQARFIPNPFSPGNLYKTGDLARYLNDGNIEHLGRSDGQVKIRGFRIELGEIEGLLAKHPIVQEGVVTVREDVPGDKRLIAYVVPTQEGVHQSLESTLRNYFKEHLPNYMVPSAIVVLEKMPLTPSGKVDRRSLPQPDISRREVEEALILPQSDIEKIIAHVWQQVIQLEEVGIHDNFFDLGGNSLLLIQVHKKLIEIFNKNIPTVTLFQYTTIYALAQHLNKTAIAPPNIGYQKPTKRQGYQASDIAIIGMSGRFPGAENIETFWHNLRDGVESISFFSDAEIELPDPSLLKQDNYVKASSILPNIDLFDAQFFGYSPKEAEIIDPQQRIFLETAWEAFENAGYNPKNYQGAVGVFAGSGMSTYLINNVYPYQGFSAKYPFLEFNSLQARLGNERNYFPTRISYKLSLTGPSLNIQTACSTSLVAVHVACQNLRNGECDMALAGGVSIVVPQKTGYLYQEGMVHSPDGCCRTFDAQAQGTVFGSGCGIVMLKRLDDAIADKDNIYAIIKASAINNDGALKVGYTAPSVEGQAKVIAEALALAEIDSSTMSYVEAHGTATPLGDPIEVAALTKAYRENTSSRKNGFCAIGSVKTNVGHLDEAAGITSLIKTILALKHKLIPPSLHFTKPNPNIDFDNSPFYVNTTLSEWQTQDTPRRAGVSSFGMGGTNCHVILEEAPKEIQSPNLKSTTDRTWHLLTLSAKTNQALAELAQRYVTYLESEQKTEIADICFTANTGREHFNYRTCLVANSKQQLKRQLVNFINNPELPPITAPKLAFKKRIAFLFTGQGSQYVDMGRQLYETQPTFRQIIDDCDEILHPYLEVSLRSILYPDRPSNHLQLNETAYTQPALFVLEYALAELWKSWGIEPDVVMGHSVGEYVAAAIAGVFSLEDGLKLIAARGRLMQSLPPDGEMVALLASEEQALAAIASLDTNSQQVSIAAINGPQSVVVSGQREAISILVTNLEASGIKTKKLNVSHAFHSTLMQPMLAKFKQITESVKFYTPQIKINSNVTGTLITDEIATPEYWCRHILMPVQFAASMATLAQQEIDVFIEIGPKPILLAMGCQCLSNRAALWLPSLRPEQEDWHSLLTSLRDLYVQGVSINWVGFDRDYTRRRQALPTYPFQRQRYWVEIPKDNGTQELVLVASNQSAHPLLGQQISLPGTEQIRFQCQISKNFPKWLEDHRVFATIIVPGTAYIEMALAAGVVVAKTSNLTLENVLIRQPLTLTEDGSHKLVHLVLTSEAAFSYRFEIFSLEPTTEANKKQVSWILHVSGKLITQVKQSPNKTMDLATLKNQCQQEISLQLLYQRHIQQNIDYGPSFFAIDQLWRNETAALGKICLPEPVKFEVNDYLIHPILLDACLQILDATLMDDDHHNTYVPVGVERLQMYARASSVIWCYAQLYQKQGNSQVMVKADLHLFTLKGELIALVEGVQLQQVPQSVMLRTRQQSVEDWLYKVEWRPQQRNVFSSPQISSIPSVSFPKQWLILADSQGTGQKLSGLFHSQGDRCALVFPGQEYEQIGEQEYKIDPANPRHFQEILVVLPHIQGVINLWGLDTPSILTGENLEAVSLITCGSTLHLIQGLVHKYHDIPSIWLVTRSAQAVADTSVRQVASSSLWGMGKVIGLEYPDLNCIRIDLDSEVTENEVQNLFEEILFLQTSEQKEDQVAFRNQVRYVARLMRCHQTQKTLTPSKLDIPKNQPFRLEVSSRGTLDGLQLHRLSRQKPKPGQVEIQVKAVGLNFIDVLNVLGLYPGNPPLGTECSGEIVAIGEGVKGFEIGTPVIAAGIDTFSQYVTLNANLVVSMPARLNFEEAATIPVAFLTAYWCLHHVAKIGSGDRVLIHAATGGVGQAAVQLAQQAGAEVFATASPNKWPILKSLGVKYIMNSRTIDFAEQVMAYTNGKGVDIVLNSLTTEGFIEKSLAVVAHKGRFLEIAKRDIWLPSQVTNFRPDISYSVVDLGQECQEQPAFIQPILCQLTQQFENGFLKPLPQTVFPLSDAVSAFRYMQQGKHTGKIIIKFPDTTPESLIFRSDSSYLITGGLGDLGLLIARWMVELGARHLVLVGRSKVKPAISDQLRTIEQAGAKVVVIQADVSDTEQVTRLFTQIEQSLPPLRGIIHAAGILDDGVLHQQNWQRFAQVMAPKVQGAWNLHTLTQNLSLDFFVLFSSSSSLLGTAGQANYAAANAFLDALASYRQMRGLPGLSINWGAWAEVGMTVRSNLIGQLSEKGEGSIATQQGLQVLAQLLLENPIQVGVMSINWSRFLEKQLTISPFLADFLNLSKTQSQQQALTDFQTLLEATPVIERQGLLAAHVCQQVAKVLGLASPEKIEPGQKLIDLGLDSLMAIEFRSHLQSSLKCSLPSTLIFDYPTIGALVNYLSEEVLLLSSNETATKGFGKNNIIIDESDNSTLVPVQPQGSKLPLFFVPGVLGNVLDLYPLARHLGLEQPFYGLRSLGLDENEKPFTRMVDIAAHHIKALQAVRPQGPYLLGGHSFGGRVAFEMAQQLQHQGHQVSMLILVDSWVTSLDKYQDFSVPENLKFITDLGELYQGIINKNLEFIPAQSQTFSSLNQQLNYLLEILQRSGFKLTKAEIERIFQVYKANTVAFVEYIPQVHYPTLITLFRASDIGMFDFLPDAATTHQDPTWGWCQLSGQSVELNLVPGNHFTMMSEPLVQILGKQLKICLEKIVL